MLNHHRLRSPLGFPDQDVPDTILAYLLSIRARVNSIAIMNKTHIRSNRVSNSVDVDTNIVLGKCVVCNNAWGCLGESPWDISQRCETRVRLTSPTRSINIGFGASLGADMAIVREIYLQRTLRPLYRVPVIAAYLIPRQMWKE